MHCIRCGTNNNERALYCTMCGEPFVRPAEAEGQTEGDVLTIPGTSYTADNTENLDKQMVHCANRASLFVFVSLVFIVVIALGVVFSGAVGRMLDPEGLMTAAERSWAVGGILGFLGLIFFAFLTGKTAQALGSSFWGHFLPTLLPPFVPGVMAHIGRYPIWKPYLWLLLDAGLGVLAWQFFETHPLLMFVVMLGLAGAVPYHLMGCSVNPIGSSLGLPGGFTTGWFSFLPIAFFLYRFATGGALRNLADAIASFDIGISASVFWSVFDVQDIQPGTGQFYLVILFGLFTLGFWIKAIQENLRYPVMD